MSLASALESALARALSDVATVVDDVLLSRHLKSVGEDIAQRHYIEPVRLHQVILDMPRPTRIAVPGDPGQEEPGGSPVVVRGTAVELIVTIDGASTMALAAEGDDDLEHAGVRVDPKGKRLVVRYATEYPRAQAANLYFDEALRLIEVRVETVNKAVGEFNDALEPAILKELEECKDLATTRKKFAAGLKLPGSYENWWGLTQSPDSPR
jgi:hypothetical protein